jgi:aldose 1-epimerase
VTEVELALGDQRVVVTSAGARVLTYVVADRAVLDGREIGAARAWRSSLLAPWPNRVAHSRWSWRGHPLQLPLNEPNPGTALHGLVAEREFRVADVGATQASFRLGLCPQAGYPFTLQFDATYRLTQDGLCCSLSALNTGTGDAPVALGVHPYVAVPGSVDDLELRVPARAVLVMDRWYQTNARLSVAGSGLDYSQPRRLGTQVLDTCWGDVAQDADGRSEAYVRLPSGDHVTIWGGPTARYWLVYTGDTLLGDARRRSVALEPCTAPPNALRSGVDLDILRPGQELELTWGVSPSWLTSTRSA